VSSRKTRPPATRKVPGFISYDQVGLQLKGETEKNGTDPGSYLKRAREKKLFFSREIPPRLHEDIHPHGWPPSVNLRKADREEKTGKTRTVCAQARTWETEKVAGCKKKVAKEKGQT